MRRLLLAGVLVGLAVVASTVGAGPSVAQAARDPKEIQALVDQFRKSRPAATSACNWWTARSSRPCSSTLPRPAFAVMVHKEGVRDRPARPVKRVQKLEHGSVAGKIVLWTAVGVLALFGIAVATCAAA